MQLSGPTFPVPCFGSTPASRSGGIGRSVDVWLARTEALLEPGSERVCRGLLSGPELAHCGAFQREDDRRRALLARGLLRETLSRYAPVAPESWEFRSGAHGKPEIALPAQPRLRFNLSHAGGLVACAVTLDHDIGVDLEDTTRACDPLELGERVFTDEENRGLRGLTGRARQWRFFELWTLKEAWLKARGSGFALAPRSVSFDLGDPERIQARFERSAQDDPADWWFALFEPEPGQVLALATRNGGLPASVRAFRATPGREPFLPPDSSGRAYDFTADCACPRSRSSCPRWSAWIPCACSSRSSRPARARSRTRGSSSALASSRDSSTRACSAIVRGAPDARWPSST
jgi:4'-phosphopantetheinyl transferase